MHITPLGDRAIVVELGHRPDARTHHRVQAARRLLTQPPLPGVLEVVPAHTTVTVFYDPTALMGKGHPAESLLERLSRAVRERLAALPDRGKHPPGRTVEIPVCYGGPYGPDLAAVAAHAGWTPSELIRQHVSTEHLVHMIGFSPGFPYLGGLPEALAIPRRATPRVAVPPGSVGIANRQSCIYPYNTPGGWHLVGRTPRCLFRPDCSPPSLLQAGDHVQFREITPDEFESWQEPEPAA